VFLRLSFLTGGITALSLLTGPLQARALGPSGRGELAAIAVVGAFLPVIAGLGLEFFVARETARGAPKGDLIGTVGLTTLLVGLLIAPLGFPISALLAHGRHTVYIFILLQFLLLPLSLLGQGLYYMLVGLERWSYITAIRVIASVGPVPVIVVLFVLHAMTVRAVAVATVLTSLLSLIPGLLAVRRVRGFHFRMPMLRVAIPFSLKTWLGTLAVLTNGRIDQLLMIGLTSSRQLGLYAVAVTATSLSNQIVSSLSSPLLARVAGGERHLVRRAVRVTLLLVMIVNACVAVVAPFLIPLLFGSSFSDSVPMMLILLVASLPLCVTLVLTPATVADGNPAVPAIGEGMTLLITIPGLLLVLPSLGGTGAALVSLVAYGFDAVYQLWRARANFGGAYHEYVIPRSADVAWTRNRVADVLTSARIGAVAKIALARGRGASS